MYITKLSITVLQCEYAMQTFNRHLRNFSFVQSKFTFYLNNGHNIMESIELPNTKTKSTES